MTTRLRLIQGGLSQPPRAAAPAEASRAAGWRVELMRASRIGEAQVAGWRALVEAMPRPDPFADPDFLLPSAQHGARGADIAFAFVRGETDGGAPVLGGVVPLVLPHPVWGGPTVRLWQPPLAPRLVEPSIAPGIAAAATDALVSHLRARRPRAVLRLDGDHPLDAAVRRHRGPIPADRLIDLRPVGGHGEIDLVEDAGELRDAVERFLVLDAETSAEPLLVDPSVAATIRVVARLFGRRGRAGVAFGWRDGGRVAGQLRLHGPLGAVPWRGAGPVADRDAGVSAGSGARLRLVGD